jgi:type VI secretion system protein ImpA
MNADYVPPLHSDGGAVQPAFDALLAPVTPEVPCGPAIRHDPLFTEIRLLREEDDPSLPMRQWERPLKRADWARIDSLCSTALAARSKDLHLAAWLAEAWTRQRGLAGLADGLRLLDALLRRYWQDIHPALGEDGDSDARLAPIEWLNGALAGCVRLHAPLFTLDGERALPVTLALWERLSIQETAPPTAADKNAPAAAVPPPTRAAILAGAAQVRPLLAQAAAAAAAGLDALRALAAVLHGHLGDEAPKLAKLESALESVLRLLAHLQPDAPQDGMRSQDAPLAGDDGGAFPVSAAAADTAAGADDFDGPAGSGVPAMPADSVVPGHWRSRREAYATLEALAGYLSEVEPHSPTPFLLRRAVRWGRMSLPEVIAEIIREEGDVSRLFQILGIKVAQA